jgi:hypothetical protein
MMGRRVMTMDDERRDAELDAAIEIFVRQTMAEGYSRGQAVEMARQELHHAARWLLGMLADLRT